MSVNIYTNQSSDNQGAARNNGAPSGKDFGDKDAECVQDTPHVESGFLGGIMDTISSVAPMVGGLVSGLEPLLGLFDTPARPVETQQSYNTTDLARDVLTLGFKKDDYNKDQSHMISSSGFSDMRQRIQIPSRLATYTWTTATTGLVAAIPVSPSYSFGYSQGVYTYMHPSMLGAATIQYTWWRGTLIYDIDLFPSQFHQGQLYVAFNPTPENVPTSLNDLRNLQGVTINLGVNSSISVSVPYVYPLENCAVSQNLQVASNIVTENPHAGTFTGTLYIWQQNPLALSNSGVSNSVDINVSISAGEDFELKVPRNIGKVNPTFAGSYVDREVWVVPENYKAEPQGDRKPINVMSVPTQMLVDTKASTSENMRVVGSSKTIDTSTILEQEYLIEADIPFSTSDLQGARLLEFALPKKFFEANLAPKGLALYHNFFRGDFKVVFKIASTQFHQGCLRAFFVPSATSVNYNYLPAKGDSWHSWQASSQLPHADINVCGQTEASFIVPFTSIARMLDKPTTNVVGHVCLDVWNQLRTGTGGSTTIHVSVWISAIDANLSVRNVPQGDLPRQAEVPSVAVNESLKTTVLEDSGDSKIEYLGRDHMSFRELLKREDVVVFTGTSREATVDAFQMVAIGYKGGGFYHRYIERCYAFHSGSDRFTLTSINTDIANQFFFLWFDPVAPYVIWAPSNGTALLNQLVPGMGAIAPMSAGRKIITWEIPQYSQTAIQDYTNYSPVSNTFNGTGTAEGKVYLMSKNRSLGVAPIDIPLFITRSVGEDWCMYFNMPPPVIRYSWTTAPQGDVIDECMPSPIIQHLHKDLYFTASHNWRATPGFSILRDVGEDVLVVKGPFMEGGIYSSLKNVHEILEIFGSEGEFKFSAERSQEARKTSGIFRLKKVEFKDPWQKFNSYKYVETYATDCVMGECGTLVSFNDAPIGMHTTCNGATSTAILLTRELFDCLYIGKDPLMVMNEKEIPYHFIVKEVKGQYEAVIHVESEGISRPRARATGKSKIESRRKAASKYLDFRSDGLLYANEGAYLRTLLKSNPKGKEQSCTSGITKVLDAICHVIGMPGRYLFKKTVDSAFGIVSEDVSQQVQYVLTQLLKTISIIFNLWQGFKAFTEGRDAVCAGHTITLLALCPQFIDAIRELFGKGEQSLSSGFQTIIHYIMGTWSSLFGIDYTTKEKSFINTQIATYPFQYIKQNLPKIITDMWEKIMGRTPRQQSNKYVEDNLEKLKDFIDLYNDLRQDLGKPSDEQRVSLEKIVAFLDESDSYFSTANRNPAAFFAREVRQAHRKLVMNERATKPRVEPIGVWIYGPPGTGKSTGVQNICDYLLQATKLKTAGNDIYSIPNDPEQSYFDGYNGQPIALFDDAGATTEAKEMGKFINLISESVAPVPMAHLEDKCTTFTSAFIVATSNSSNIGDVNAIKHKAAVARRFPFFYKFGALGYGLKFSYERFQKDMATVNAPNVKGKFCDVFDKHYKIFKGDFGFEANTRIGCQQLLDELVEEYEKKVKSFDVKQKNRKLDFGFQANENEETPTIVLEDYECETACRGGNWFPDFFRSRYFWYDALVGIKRKSVAWSLLIGNVFKTKAEATWEACKYIKTSVVDCVMSKYLPLLVGVITAVIAVVARWDVIGKLKEFVCSSYVRFTNGLKSLYSNLAARQRMSMKLLKGGKLTEHWIKINEDVSEGIIGYKGSKNIPYYVVYPDEEDDYVEIAKAMGTYDEGEHKYWINLCDMLTHLGEQSHVQEIRRTRRKPLKMREQSDENYRLKRNIVPLFDSEESGRPMTYAIFLNDHSLLINKHVLFPYDGRVRDHAFIALRGVRHKISLDRGRSIGNTDAYIVRTSQFQRVSDIVSRFVTQSEIDNVLGSSIQANIMTSYTTRNYDIGAVIKMDSLDFHSENSAMKDTIITAAVAHQVTEVGECGTPYITNSDRILGIHSFLSDYSQYQADVGFSLVTRNSIEEVLKQLVPVTHVEFEIPILTPAEQAWDGNSKGFVHAGHFDRFDKRLKVNTPRTTKYCHAELRDDETWPDRSGPSYKSEEINITRVQKYQFKKQPTAPENIHTEFAFSLYNDIFGKFPERPQRVLTDQQVLNGFGSFKEMKVDSSAGIWNYISVGKKNFIDVKCLDDGNVYSWSSGVDDAHPILGRSLKQQLKIREDLGKKGIRFNEVFWSSTLKDELLPVEKLEAGKTRVFECPPIDTTFLLKKYFGDFLTFYRNFGGNVLSHTIGIEKEAVWPILTKSLKKRGGKVIAADYSQYDGSITGDAYDFYRRVVHLYYNDETLEEASMRDVLIHELQHTLLLVGDKVTVTEKGNNSGQVATDVFNNVINVRNFMIAFSKEYKRIFCEVPTLSQWFANSTLYCHGDDCVFAMSEFTPLRPDLIVQTIRDLGFFLTSADKSGDEIKEVPLESTTYLKSGFLVEEGVYWPTMPYETAYKELNWCKKQWKNDTRIRSTQISEAQRFMSFHGRAEYDLFCAELRLQIIKHPQFALDPPANKTWDQHRNEMFDKQLMSSFDEGLIFNYDYFTLTRELAKIKPAFYERAFGL